MHWASIDAHFALIAGMHAGYDLHERALAGAVLADETVDLADLQRKIDGAQGLHAAERLGDAGEFEQRRTHRGGTCKRFAQMRNWSSIHSMPSALALVTTGPSVTMFFGMSVPVLAPLMTADTPAMTAPP